jgi:hypothetical protein
MLVQQLFGPSDKECLISLVDEKAFTTVETYSYHLIVYAKDYLPGTIIHLAGDEARKSELIQLPDLCELITHYPDLTFKDALFITTVFTFDPSHLLNGHKDSALINHKIPVIREWLSDTRGLLLYAHQLEQIFCMLTGKSYPEAISFRKDWNLKRPSSRQTASELFITKDYTLLDLLYEATLDKNHFAYNANFSGAYRLYQYILGSKR